MTTAQRGATAAWPAGEPLPPVGQSGGFVWGPPDEGDGYALGSFHVHAVTDHGGLVGLLGWFSAPEDCLAYIVSGVPAAICELVAEHGRGEHTSQRDPRCRSCEREIHDEIADMDRRRLRAAQRLSDHAWAPILATGQTPACPVCSAAVLAPGGIFNPHCRPARPGDGTPYPVPCEGGYQKRGTESRAPREENAA